MTPSEASHPSPIGPPTSDMSDDRQSSSHLPSIDDPSIISMNLTSSTQLTPKSLYSFFFQSDEDILEDLSTPNFPWDSFHHQSFFLSHNAFQPHLNTLVYAIEDKYLIPPGHVDWFKKTIFAPNAFEEGNMESISYMIKIDISIKPNIIE